MTWLIVNLCKKGSDRGFGILIFEDNSFNLVWLSWMSSYSMQQGGKEKGETIYSYQKANRLMYSLFMIPKEFSVDYIK